MNSPIERPGKPHIVLIALYSYESFGLRTLFTILKKNGFKTTLIFFKELKWNNIKPPAKGEIQRLLDLLKRLSPTLVGLSVGSTFVNTAVRITRDIQKSLGVPVIWGGLHPTIRPDECLTHADAVCVGEADEAILDLAGALSEGREIAAIGNFWTKKDGRIVQNPSRPLIPNLDAIPFLDRAGEDKYWIEDEKTRAGDPIWDHRGLLSDSFYIMASRGCPYQCTYCSNSVLKELSRGKGPFVRKRSVRNVLEELTEAKKQFPIKRVRFFDEVFVLDRAWIKEFCRRYPAEIGLPFSCVFHPETVKADIVSLLVDAGLDDVNLGIQSGSERIRSQIYKRPGSNEDIRKAADLLNKHGVMCYYDLILDNPYETEDDKRETLRLLLDLPRPFNLSMFSLTWLPQTTLSLRALSEGMITEDQVEGRAEKTRSHWRMRLDLTRTKEDLFWNSLIFLTSLRFNSMRNSRSHHLVPKSILRSLMSSRFLRKHPKALMVPSIALALTIDPSNLHGFALAPQLTKLHIFFRLLLKGDFSRIIGAGRAYARGWKRSLSGRNQKPHDRGERSV